ncbi:hypothetical protein SAMN04488056_10319 [Cohaesibacter marisflavi]|uniref:DUF4926 domain-containing protein n=1 Tax=Cohaesibacter marisflavi TaxID=655353 RepID=A0A1I5E4P2_9HYPH|nr:hypothetical protein SAMN04488056_10319 [Cohaesibacter marisflavi]
MALRRLKIGNKVRIRDFENSNEFLDGVGTIVEVQDAGLGIIIKVAVGESEDWYLSERLEPLLHVV